MFELPYVGWVTVRKDVILFRLGQIKTGKWHRLVSMARLIASQRSVGSLTTSDSAPVQQLIRSMRGPGTSVARKQVHTHVQST